jgi:hypothetical protein
VVLDESEALRRAIAQMVKGEVIVVFYEKLQPIQRLLEEFSAEPVPALPPLPVDSSRTKTQPRFKRSFPTRSAILRPRRTIPVSP